MLEAFLSKRVTLSFRSFIVASAFWYEGQAKVAPLFRATLSLQCFLSEYMSRLKEAAEFLETTEGETAARDAHNILYRSNESKLIDWNAYKMGKCVVTGVQHVKQALDIKMLVDFIQADYYAFNGARLGLSTHLDSQAVAPGCKNPLLEDPVVSAGVTSLRVLSSSMKLVGAAFGVWNSIDSDAHKIANVSELAKKIRKSSKDFNEECEKLIALHKALDPVKLWPLLLPLWLILQWESGNFCVTSDKREHVN